MALLEVISVRLFEPKKARLIQLLFSDIEQGLPGETTPEKAFLYQSCDITGDWNVQLLWADDTLQKMKTPLGRHLAEFLRTFGFVHHTMWQTFSTVSLGIMQQGLKDKENEIQN